MLDPVGRIGRMFFIHTFYFCFFLGGSHRAIKLSSSDRQKSLLVTVEEFFLFFEFPQITVFARAHRRPDEA